MMRERMKLWVFRGLLLLLVIIAIEAIGYFGMWYNSRSVDFISNKSYFQIRAMLMGDKNPEHFPRYLSLPHLGYIQYPGYKKHDIVQNNEDGYRGEKVPIQKTGKLRVLCIGGSTTYGYAVDSPYQAYPARLQVLLNNYLLQDSILGKKYSGAEVINAGLEAGTSAEELQQYLFKYRYYEPDIVIIHSGVNDAQLAAQSQPDFQLDYTDSRRLNFHLPPLSLSGRLLFKSYFFSFISIRLFYDRFTYNGDSGKDCFTRQKNQIFCKWSHINIDSIISERRYQFYPFYQNSKSLFASVTNDSSILVVFPNALNKKDKLVISNKKYYQINGLNASLSKSLCEQCGAIYVPFDYDSIQDPTCWVDDCHLNVKGEENKAEILFRVVINKLKQHIRAEN